MKNKIIITIRLICVQNLNDDKKEIIEPKAVDIFTSFIFWQS